MMLKIHRVKKKKKPIKTQTHGSYQTCLKIMNRTLKKSKVKVKESESHSVVSDSLQSRGLYSPWNSPGQNTEVGSLSLLQGILPIQGSNPGHQHHWQILYQLSHKGSLKK